ncbi:MAG: AraC family transcriptional regulator [Erysipelotrichaceae bacterium]|nr:AraC family transcriptional regulator [Erysipelotrichaceae bacterium]
MFIKTSSIAYKPYGNIVQDISSFPYSRVEKHTIHRHNKTINQLFTYTSDIYIRVVKGMVLLLVNEEPSAEGIQQFVIHRVTKVKKGVYMNFLAMSDQIKLDIYTAPSAQKQFYHIEHNIEHHKTIESFHIPEIYAYYYQIRHSDYFFAGEEHSYWELTYIDNGQLVTEVDGIAYELKTFDLMIYTPHQFHSQQAFEGTPCSYITIMFDMDLKDPTPFQNKIFHLNKDTHRILNNFMKLAATDQSPYSKDLLLCYLKELLVYLIQPVKNDVPITEMPIQQQSENDLLNDIIQYINENIFEPLAIDEICKTFLISRSSLQTLFREQLNMAPKQYINELKLSKSKFMIKEGKYTISEITVALGFGSIHYFSRKFKQRYGITPTDYAKTIF